MIQVGALFHFLFSLSLPELWWRHVSYSPGWSRIVCVLHSNYSELILIREGILFFSGEREEDGERELQILVLLTFYQLFVAAHVGESREFLPQSSLSCHPQQQQQQSREDEE